MSEGFSDLRTAIFLSGDGSTAEAVIKAANSGELRNIDPVIVISNKPDAPGLAKATALGIPTVVVSRKGKTIEQFGDEIFRRLALLGIDFITQNGWLVQTPPRIVERYSGYIINQHPGKLTGGTGLDFGGKGMYGTRVTAATLAYAWATRERHPWTESTMHHVANEFDKGYLIKIGKLEIPELGREVTIADFKSESLLRQHLIDTSLQVQQRLLPLEHEVVISTLQMYGEGKEIPSWTREEELVTQNLSGILYGAKQLAIDLFPQG